MATFAEAPGGDAAAGAKIFKTKCAQCHVAEKGGGHKQGEHILTRPSTGARTRVSINYRQ